MQGVLADSQPGLVLWTDGSRDENGLVGYAVVWRKGGRKSHMGFFQEPEAHDAECAAIARALAVAVSSVESAYAQAAITRMTYDEPGPGQTYALSFRRGRR